MGCDFLMSVNVSNLRLGMKKERKGDALLYFKYMYLQE